MAGEVDDIVQNVVLTGNEQVAEAFNSRPLARAPIS
jgi:hypothetical protein